MSDRKVKLAVAFGIPFKDNEGKAFYQREAFFCRSKKDALVLIKEVEAQIGESVLSPALITTITEHIVEDL